jgi:ABC-type antimicrobial peptide transport system permease subunit
LYGLVSYLVAQRRKEIGLRFALGATRQHVIGLVLKHAFHSALPGILVGLILAFATTRWFEGLLFEVQARNPGIFAAAALALFLVVILASLVPSWRGAQVDPASVLRQD